MTIKATIKERTEERFKQLFHEQQDRVYVRTDRMFRYLLLIEWLAGIITALVISPRSWSGVISDVHIHVWTAVWLGGLIVSWPIYMSYKHPGSVQTRHAIAVGQMLYSAVLIHLTGGRIETHFHVFGSLAFLSFYRDWRVLISASVVVAGDHFLRGLFFPRSVYGVDAIEPWRWVEHAWWVVFEDVFLIWACHENVQEMRRNALRQAEIEATRATVEEREEAERRVSEFYSIVSHELRTPLTSIRGALGLIEGGIVEPGTEQMNELISVARESSDRLIRLINDMLDLKKIESGKMEFKMRPVNTSDLIAKTLSALDGMSKQCNVVLKSETVHGTVYGDFDKLTQVLTNLVSNAMKFSPPGSSVTVQTEILGEFFRFNIIDNGPGIAAEDLDKLFVKFQQLDSSDTRQQGGTGLGLAISRALIEQHGGQIGVQTEVGKGSVFWFELAVHNDLEVEPEANRREPLHVLLIEDDDGLAAVLKVVIEKSGYVFSRVSTVSDALQVLQNTIPAVVVLDLTLPDGSGLVILEHLRSQRTTEHVPVIVSTGQQRDDRIVASGANVDWLAKPFDPQRLIASIQRALNVPGKCKVLIVDDDSSTRTILSAQLRTHGLECIEAEDGFEAVYLSRKEAIDLMVLDVKMPNMDGFQVVKALRQDRKMRGTPLIIYTGRDLSEDERQSLSLGLTAYVAKNGDSDLQLAETISALISQSRALEQEAARLKITQ